MTAARALGVGIVLAPFISAALLAIRWAGHALYRSIHTHTRSAR
jgi:hypothetical protein